MPETTSKKIEYWKNQLLDLGKRNKMINYRETTRATLQIIEPEFSDLFNNIVTNEIELIFQYPVDKDSDVRTYSVLQLLGGLSCPISVFLGDIKTFLPINERQKTLKNLRSKSKLALEEQGINILYLSFGFIQWKEKGSASSGWIKSPLILVPVSIVADSLNAPYKLVRYDDDIVINPTLNHLFEAEYGITLPHLDSDNPNLEEFMQNMEKIVCGNGWKVIRETSLGLLSFLKINMYKDLENNLENMMQNPVIKALLGDAKEINHIPKELVRYNHDTILPKECFQVISADSSQQDAILYSKNGVSFVMQGPPGTGKSQTITNIIAEALADGKKVLFVSEKMAALQVVHNKLTELGLGEFCLALHSHKANKKEILDDIQNTLLQKKTRVKDEAIEELNRLRIERDLLNEYAKELHAIVNPLEISCYKAFGILDELKNASDVEFNFDGITSITREQLNEIVYNLSNYHEAINKHGFKYNNNPWVDIVIKSITYDLRQNIDNRTNTLIHKLSLIINEMNGFKKKCNIDYPDSIKGLEGFVNDLLIIVDFPIIPRELFSNMDTEQLISETKKVRGQFLQICNDKNNVKQYFVNDIWNIDIQGLIDICSENIKEVKSCNIMQLETQEVVLNNINNIYTILDGLYKSTQRIKNAVKNSLDLLGLSMPLAFSNISTIYNLLLVLDKKPIAMPQWFDMNLIDDALSHVDDYKELTNKINCNRNVILQDWDNDVFNINYNEILNRYRTEYNNIFKYLKKEYRKDKKAILLHHKNPLAKINDKDIIELLLKLQDLYERIEILENSKTTIDKLYGKAYTGTDTNWGNIAFGLNCIREILVICPELSNAKDFKKLLMSGVENAKININKIIEEMSPEIISEFINNFNSAYENMDCIDMGIDNVCSILTSTMDAASATAKDRNNILELLQSKSITADCFEKLQMAATVQESEKALMDNGDLFKKNYGDFYKNENTEWDYIIDVFMTLKRISDIVNKYELPNEFFEKISCDRLYKSQLNAQVSCVADILDEIKNDFEWYNSLFESDLSALSLPVLLNKCVICHGNVHLLEMWLDYEESKNKCLENGLNDYIKKIEANMVEDITDAFKKGFYRLWLDAIIEQKPAISNFKGRVQDRRVSDFCTMDKHQLQIARMRIREKLTYSLPSKDRFLHAQDEMSVLQRELGKKKRIMPIRKLFRTIPNMLLKIKPCFMMSPLSVSYFLEAQTYKFDMVIFDEASQIFPQDAIGAIFRGKQVVIAGDSKQLPPTNFFASNTNNLDGQFDYDNEDDVEEEIYDSILEEAEYVLPSRELLWHYRSKHEHLIAFSNNQIYKNSLITFPSCKDKCVDMGVEYYKVLNGIYEERCNINEAKKCVELVKEHIERHPNRSLGIIAFSEKQQSTIEFELLRFRERNHDYEWFFDENREEAFFVKNLENVQGDERDTIIFSICYAKNKKGQMLMNFGPLGKQGGERRLNVAVTRAKLNIKVVGSIDPTDIDLSRAKTEGARMLRSYIEFAVKGSAALTEAKNITADDDQDKLCDSICKFLRFKGYVVKQNVGCSDYKIDIVVEHPKHNGIYIAGIECDGNSYIKARTARERDHLRSDVLKSMGWTMYRIWSTDWVKQPTEEENKLIKFLNDCEEQFGLAIPVKNECSNYEVPIEAINAIKTNNQFVRKCNNPYGFENYIISNWWDAPQNSNTSNERRISEVLSYIIEIEQPIHIDLLYRRVAGLFGREKATSPVRAEVDYVMKNILSSKLTVNDGFVNMKDMDEVKVRVSEIITEEARPIEYISVAEISKAMIVIANSAFGISEKEIITETARIFGFERTGPKIVTAMNKAIGMLLQSNKIRITDEKIQVLEEVWHG